MRLLVVGFVVLAVTIVSAQESPNPDLTIPLFTYPSTATRTFRQDFCARSNQVQVLGNLTLGDAVRGLDIHVALMQGDFVKFDESNDDSTTLRLDATFPGLVPRLLDELCTRAGCTWRNTYTAPSYADASLTNRTFLELLSWSIEVYDLMAEWWMRSVERLQAGAVFNEPWYDATIIMVAPKPGEERDAFDPWGWLAPFDTAVWIMVVATVATSALVHWLLQYLNPHKDETTAVKLDPFEATWLFATAFAGQFEFDPQTAPARLFTFSIAFWALLMTSAYTANLASFLVIRNTPDVRIESLDQAIALQQRLCIWRSSGTDVAVTNTYPAYATSEYVHRSDSTLGLFQDLRDGKCDIAVTEVSTWDVFSTDERVNGDCGLSWIGRPFQSIPASFAVKGDAGTFCTSLLRDVFNLYLHDMQSDGTIDALWKEHIDYQATVTCSAAGATDAATDSNRRRQLEWESHQNNDKKRHLKSTVSGSAAEASAVSEGDDPETTKLTLTNMGGVFMLHGILTGLSVLCAMIHYATASSKTNAKPRKRRSSLTDLDHKAASKTSKLGSDDDSPINNSEEDDDDENASASSLYYFDAEGGPRSSSVEALRAEMKHQLQSIEEKLALLLAKQ